jgi:hypothetical protein
MQQLLTRARDSGLPALFPRVPCREYNHKRGFKCVYERGIIHLYFNFQRQRYRR